MVLKTEVIIRMRNSVLGTVNYCQGTTVSVMNFMCLHGRLSEEKESDFILNLIFSAVVHWLLV